MSKRLSNDEQPLSLEVVPVADLKPHPRNVRSHPEDEIEHLAASIKQYGIYRNIVVAKDLTILAGHGVVLAAVRAGRDEVPVKRLDLEPSSPAALKLLALDNTVAHLAEDDDRALSVLLKEIAETEGLLGTGYDEMMLANLVMVTRPASEIANIDEAAQWVGMPEYEPGEDLHRLIVLFRTEADRVEFMRTAGLEFTTGRGAHTTAWWPPRDPQDRIADRSSVRFQETTSYDLPQTLIGLPGVKTGKLRD